MVRVLAVILESGTNPSQGNAPRPTTGCSRRASPRRELTLLMVLLRASPASPRDSRRGWLRRIANALEEMP